MNAKREVVVSQILAPEILRELELLGYKHIFAKPSQTLTTELRYHPDILGFRLPDGKWISEADGIVLTDAYPGDCIFNCVSIGKTLIYGNSFIAQKFGCMFDYMLKVRQSYVKCSCIVLDDKAMITSDPSIYRALNGTFDVLKTSNENIFLNGTLLGYSESLMKEHFDEIVDFAELWDFLDMPIKNYSSGMSARLGFSVATMVRPDILICDEVLAVGDYKFQEKCIERMQQMLDNGTTLLYVSHTISSVEKLCQKALWLNKGKAVMQGDAADVCHAYMNE